MSLLGTGVQEIATLEGKKAALEMGAAAVREEQGLLQRELESLQLSVEAAKADVTNAQQNLRALQDKVSFGRMDLAAASCARASMHLSRLYYRFSLLLTAHSHSITHAQTDSRGS